VRIARHCATIPDTVRVLCGVAGVIPRHCATRSHPSSTPRPSKRDGNTLEECTTANLMLAQDDAVIWGERGTFPSSPPALCSHPQPCATIPGAVEPSSALWIHVLMGAPHQALYSTSAPVSKTLELVYERRPGVDADQTTLEVTPRQVQKPLRHLREPGSVGTPIKSQVLHASTTILYKKPCSTSVSRLPLSYKRRQSPGRGDRITFIRTRLHAHSPNIGTSLQSHVSSHCLAPAIERLITTHFTS
jgi:hypothetical protein